MTKKELIKLMRKKYPVTLPVDTGKRIVSIFLDYNDVNAMLSDFHDDEQVEFGLHNQYEIMCYHKAYEPEQD